MKNGKFYTPPSLSDVLDLYERSIMENLRVALPGTIWEYDSVKKTAKIQPGYNRIYVGNAIVPMALLVDCPVFTLQGGGLHLGMPIQKGDECLVIFADANIDAWWQNGDIQTPLDGRRHSLSDGIALVGINSQKNLMLSTLTPTEGGIAAKHVILGPTNAKIALDTVTKKVTVQSDQASLLVVLNGLTTAVSGLANSPSPDNNILGILNQLTDAILSVTAALSIDSALDLTTKAAALAQVPIMTDIKNNKIPNMQSAAASSTGSVSTDIAKLLY